MSTDDGAQRRREIEAAVAEDIAPALSAHAGGIRIVSVSADHVDLEFVRSCNACYFRTACGVNLVLDVVRERVGASVSVAIKGVDLSLFQS